MANTWPNGIRKPMTQAEHERWNACNYPGTLQLCDVCEQPSGRCEEDSLYHENADGSVSVGPLCPDCYESAILRSI